MVYDSDEAKRRFKALKAGHGNRGGTGIFPGTRDNQKISPAQLVEVKRLFELKWQKKAIGQKMNLSQYIIKMALRGHYDHILED